MDTALQAEQPATMVIEGGTLIDGNGGEPVSDALIVVEGDRFKSVSRKGQISYAAGAQVLKADGKFILPGLINVGGNGVRSSKVAKDQMFSNSLRGRLARSTLNFPQFALQS